MIQNFDLLLELTQRLVSERIPWTCKKSAFERKQKYFFKGIMVLIIVVKRILDLKFNFYFSIKVILFKE